MSNEALNTLILSVFLAAIVGAGYYVTKKQQPAELEKLTTEIEAIENRSAEVETLMREEAVASDEAALTLKRWNTRYKVLPAELTSPDVVAYLNALSARGFARFDYSLSGLTQDNAASYYTYQITGEAYFESLYSFIWFVENNRGLYRIRDLSIRKNVTTTGDEGAERQVVLADFSMAVDAFVSTNSDISAPDSAVTVPAAAYPARAPAVNPFFPFIFESLPPNTYDDVDVETDSLISVIGRTAVFMRQGEIRQLRAGDRVYLGRIANVDPSRGRVSANLNKGGIRESVEITLDTGERYRQHLGGTTFAPNGRTTRVPAGPTLDAAPPAPGTPEARGLTIYTGPDAPPTEQPVFRSRSSAELGRGLPPSVTPGATPDAAVPRAPAPGGPSSAPPAAPYQPIPLGGY